MRYADFENMIHRTAVSASESARCAFALDTMGRLHNFAKEAIHEEFTDTERILLTEILANLEREPAQILKQKLQEVNDNLCQDPIRAIELNPNVTELLCAIDSWLDYRVTGEPAYVARIAINMVNAVDYAIGGDVGEYSTENMFGAPEMVAEYQRQQRMLVGVVVLSG